ncbi:GNAT family N-acetyltransferase [Brevibacterium sp.]|uniref:GNAT family N-acetyltransferase n=1 Tax=Brevibacterium sp. TaxID=1701 RepID=UPI002811C418|nr:GNAT family N-acetyltransferase [Brevibacterium sp.]
MNEDKTIAPAEVGAGAADTDVTAADGGANFWILPLSADSAKKAIPPFLDLCINWSMDKPHIDLDEILERDDAKFYFEDWGRTGDIAVAAWDRVPEDTSFANAMSASKSARSADESAAPADRSDDAIGTSRERDIIGLAWLRLSTEESTGFGWVAADIPELSLAVRPEYQAHGVGTRLLEAACSLARMSGHHAVSLAIEDGNTAADLFHKRGFVAVGRNGDSDILVRQLG